MKIHGLAFGVVAVLSHAAAFRSQFVVGINGTIAGDQLYRFTGTEQPLQTEKLVK